MASKQQVAIIGGVAATIGSGFILVQLFKHLFKKNDGNVYETQKLLNEYLMMHFGDPKELVKIASGRPSDESLSFPLQCALKCIQVAKGAAGIPSRALDVGCAVGRSTFELAHFFDEVIGIDFSHSFINAANHLKEHVKLDYTIFEEGVITSKHTASIDISIVSMCCCLFFG
jgi:SAM-dependent methyltransferase